MAITPEQLVEWARLAEEATHEQEDNEGEGWNCRRCAELMAVPYPKEPTPLCHDCAHDAAAQMGEAVPALVDEVRRLRDLADRPDPDVIARASAVGAACEREAIVAYLRRMWGVHDPKAIAEAVAAGVHRVQGG